MNPMDWLRAVRENAQKGLIPPVPPEAAPCENGQKASVPPVTPCSSVYLIENEKVCNGGSTEGEQQEIWWGEENEAASGYLRVNQGVCGENDDSGHRGDRGNQGKTMVLESVPAPERRRGPHLTPGGTLVIPFDSDPKYHWWKGGQSVKQTLAEVRAALEAEHGQVPASSSVGSEARPETLVG